MRRIVTSTIFNRLQKLSTCKRYYSSSVCEEIRIAASWGEVAGKWWGPRDKRPILALHGWQDNCGTFDRLAPLLPSHVGILALDMPGHGYSTRIPPGMFYHGIDILIFIRKIMQHFNWPKVSLLGHSLGAFSSYAYTMIFPETVDMLICLDGLFPFYRQKTAIPESMAKTIDKFLKYDYIVAKNSGNPPTYTFSEMETLLHQGSRKSIDLEICKYILKRNMAPSKTEPDRFYFTRDPRLKVGALMQWPQATIVEGSKRITCPLLFTLGTRSFLLPAEEKFLKTLDLIRANNNNVEYCVVDGTHHAHLNSPENVSKPIANFIDKYFVSQPIDDAKIKVLAC